MRVDVVAPPRSVADGRAFSGGESGRSLPKGVPDQSQLSTQYAAQRDPPDCADPAERRFPRAAWTLRQSDKPSGQTLKPYVPRPRPLWHFGNDRIDRGHCSIGVDSAVGKSGRPTLRLELSRQCGRTDSLHQMIAKNPLLGATTIEDKEAP